MDEIIIPEKIISRVAGRAVPKPANGQNTDDIIPARYLKKITFKEMGESVYFDERFKNGQPVSDHPFNDERYQGASILVAGNNYGCGSSREHAPQALKRYGIKAIIAGSYAGIFEGNCGKIGVVAVTVPDSQRAEIVNFVQNNPSVEVAIDLKKKQITYDGSIVPLGMPESRRQSFLDGAWDEMAILQRSKNIDEVEKNLSYLFFK